MGEEEGRNHSFLAEQRTTREMAATKLILVFALVAALAVIGTLAAPSPVAAPAPGPRPQWWSSTWGAYPAVSTYSSWPYSGYAYSAW